MRLLVAVMLGREVAQAAPTRWVVGTRLPVSRAEARPWLAPALQKQRARAWTLFWAEVPPRNQ